MSSRWSTQLEMSVLAALVLAIGIPSISARAAQPAYAAFNLEQTSGKPMRMIFNDGRVAVLKAWTIDSAPVSTVMKITDNTCTDKQGMTCYYRHQLRRTLADFVWLRNPDSSRVGQIVIKGYIESGVFKPSNSEGRGLNIDVLRTGGDLNHLTEGDRGLMPHELHCANFSWLPQSPDGKYVAPRWEAEQNAKNPETGLNENRSIGGYYGVTFFRSSPDVLQFTGAQGRLGALRSIDAIIVGSPLSLTLSKPDGSLCQTEMTSGGLGEVLNVYSGLEAKKPKPADMADYIVGSDNLLQDRNAAMSLKYFTDGDNSGAFQ